MRGSIMRRSTGWSTSVSLPQTDVHSGLYLGVMLHCAERVGGDDGNALANGHTLILCVHPVGTSPWASTDLRPV